MQLKLLLLYILFDLLNIYLATNLKFNLWIISDMNTVSNTT